MSAVFESETLGPTERLIMLALADHADDQGRCYPSIERLCRRTGLSERAVQSNIRKLTGTGHLSIIPGGGRKRPNLYLVNANPAADAPFLAETPQQKPRFKNPAAETPFLTTKNPAADAPEPSVTVKVGGGEEGARASAVVDAPRADPSLVAQLADALGFNGPTGTGWPRYWVAADAALIVARWKTDLGLTDDEVLQVATANMRAHGSPANGPKTLTRHMQAYADAKAAPRLEINPAAGGIRHDRATASDRRETAASDRLRREIDVAARMRRPSSADMP